MRFLKTILLLLVCLNAQAATYYVATNGVNSNPGSSVLPWLTIQKAADTMVAGDTVIVAPGLYPETVTTKANGSAGNYVKFSGTNMPIVYNWSVGNAYQWIEGFSIRGTNAPWYSSYDAMFLYTTADNCVIQSNRWEQTPLDVFHIQITWADSYNHPTNVLINGNVFKDASGQCLSICGPGHIISSNWFEKTSFTVPESGYDGDLLVINGDNGRFIGNYVTNWSRTTALAHTDLVQAFGNGGGHATNWIFEANKFVNCIASQIGNVTDDGALSHVAYWTFRNNLWFNVDAKLGISCPYFSFYNNTFWRSGMNSGSPLLFLDYGGSGGIAHHGTVINNAFIECGSNPDSAYLGFYGNQCTNFTADYNFAVGTGAGYTKAWTDLPGTQAHGLTGVDPRFVSTNNIDFRLQATSPLIGAATNLNALFSKDITGQTRGGSWDIGAYQYAAISGTWWTISPSASPSNGGTVSGGGTVTNLSSVTLTSSPNTGYVFVNWTEGGSQVSASSGYTFAATANRTLVANFGATAPPDSPPVITVQPASVTVNLGQPWSISSAVTGTSPMAVWTYRNGVAAYSSPNAHGVSLGDSSAKLVEAGTYGFVFSNYLGSATSSIATLTVIASSTNSPTGLSIFGNTEVYGKTGVR